VVSEVAVIVPVYNEEDNVLPMAREVSDAMKKAGRSYELVFVDDASTDGTWKKIEEARRQFPGVRGLRHAVNSGQSAALWTGIQASHSEIIATLDGDLQNDPADIPQMLPSLAKADFVCGVRAKRRDTFVRRSSSKIARWARRSALKVDFATRVARCASSSAPLSLAFFPSTVFTVFSRCSSMATASARSKCRQSSSARCRCFQIRSVEPGVARHLRSHRTELVSETPAPTC
jgi:glycosyltransferase involved in cell wall biosynthesis